MESNMKKTSRPDSKTPGQKNQPAPPDVLHIARTKRHMYLLERLAGGKTLRPAEMRELEQFEQLARQPESPGICRTQLQLAEVFGVTLRTVNRWTRAGCPRRPDGSYEIIAVHSWHAQRATDAARTGVPVEDDLLEGHDGEWWAARYRQLKAKQEEIMLDVLRGKYISAAAVERDQVQRILIIKSRFLALPHQLAGALYGLEPYQIQELLDARIREIIAEFAREPEPVDQGAGQPDELR